MLSILIKKMSDDNNEQITKVPDAKPASKTKDPKKVAAGKKLAELNKKAKDALAREMKRESDPEDKWLPELSFSTVLTVVGIGLTAADLFFRFYRSKKEKDSYDLTPTATTTATAITTATPSPNRSLDEDRGPRIGMV